MGVFHSVEDDLSLLMNSTQRVVRAFMVLSTLSGSHFLVEHYSVL